MNPIQEAYDEGYGDEQILNHLRRIPQLSRGINSAVREGYSVNRILNYLSGSAPEGNQKEDRHLKNPSQSRFDQQKKYNKSAKKLYGTAAALAAAYALNPGSAGAIAPELIPSDELESENYDPTTIDITPRLGMRQEQIEGPQDRLQIEGPRTPSPNQPQPPTPSPITPIQPQPNAPPTPRYDASKVLEDLGELTRVKTLMEAGNDAETIESVIKQLNPKLSKYEKSGEIPNLREVIDQYTQKPNLPEQRQQPSQPQQPIGQQPVPTPITQQPVAPIETLEPEVPNQVMTLSGKVGNVVKSDDKSTTLDVDGKKEVYPNKAIQELPLPEKDLAGLYQQLISEIEQQTGQPISRNVNFAGYDPNTNELAVQFHQGKLYVYNDINPEEAELLTSFLTQRKTTGQNFIGAWQEGTDSPIGAAMYQLIKKLQTQRGGKGNEYRNRFETLYDALEPAKEALKEKYKQEQKAKKGEKGNVQARKTKAEKPTVSKNPSLSSSNVKEKEEVREHKPNLESKSPGVKKKTELQMLEEDQGKAYDNFMKIDDKIRGKKLPDKLSKQLNTKHDAAQKRLDQANNELNRHHKVKRLEKLNKDIIKVHEELAKDPKNKIYKNHLKEFEKERSLLEEMLDNS